MKKYNKLEILGFTLLVIGILSSISEKFFSLEFLSSIYDSYGRFIFMLGGAFWAIGFYKRKKLQKNK